MLVKLFSKLILPKALQWSIHLVEPFIGLENFPENLLDTSHVYKGLNFNLDNEGLLMSSTFRDIPNQHSRMSLDLNCEHAYAVQHGMDEFFSSLGLFLKHSAFNNVIDVALDMVYLDNNNGCIASLAIIAWCHFFGALDNLQNLQIYFPGIADTALETNLFTALAGDRYDSSGNMDIVCPKLETFQVTGATFSTELGRQAFNIMLISLSFRKHKRGHLKVLKFEDCGVGLEELQEMEKQDIAEIITVN